MRNNSIRSAFNSWKIWLSVCIGLCVTIWMFYSAIQELQYIKVNDSSGNYIWVDGNSNNKIDFSKDIDFKKSENGNYIKQTFINVIGKINLSSNMLIYFSMAILFMMGRDFFYMWRIKLLTKNKLTWKRSFYVIMLWEFASALSPGIVGGSAVAMFILNREKINLGRSTVIVLISAIMDNLFYILMIPIVLLMIGNASLFPNEINQSITQIIFWAGYGIITFICLLMFTVLFLKPHWAKTIITFLFRFPFLKRFKDAAIKTGNEIEQSSIIMQKEPLTYWVKAFIATCGSWTCRYLVINALLQAFIKLSSFEHILLLGKQFVLWLFMLVSPTPGASGVAEFAFGELLSSFSESSLIIVSIAIIWRIVSYFPYLFIGVFILPSWLKKKRVNT
tara:strand:+ start:1235 stop:2407 length:1173 start_codon:yes stop_codon:yes gene_type:complete